MYWAAGTLRSECARVGCGHATARGNTGAPFQKIDKRMSVWLNHRVTMAEDSNVGRNDSCQRMGSRYASPSHGSPHLSLGGPRSWPGNGDFVADAKPALRAGALWHPAWLRGGLHYLGRGRLWRRGVVG